MDLYYFILSLVCALIGGEVICRFKMPAGRIIGGIIGVTILNLTYGNSYFYMDIRIWMQIFSGAMIGSRIGKKEVKQLKLIVFPTVILLIGMIIMNITFGGVIYKFSSLDITTSLFAVTPGGLSDMALLASTLGANTAYVGILQIFRLLIVFMVFPPIFKKIIVNKQQKNPESKITANTNNGSELLPFTMKRFIPLILCAAFGGLFFNFVGVIGGGLTGSMMGSAIYCVCTNPIKYPSLPKNGIQVLSGVFIGTDITWELIKSMNELLLPMAVMFVGFIIYVFVLAIFMHKVTKLDLSVCLLACVPGGVQEISLLSEDLNTDTPKIAIMQTARLILIITFFPTMLTFIIKLFG